MPTCATRRTKTCSAPRLQPSISSAADYLIIGDRDLLALPAKCEICEPGHRCYEARPDPVASDLTVAHALAPLTPPRSEPDPLLRIACRCEIREPGRGCYDARPDPISRCYDASPDPISTLERTFRPSESCSPRVLHCEPRTQALH